MLYLKFRHLDRLFAFDEGAETVARELCDVLVGWPCESSTRKPDGPVYLFTRKNGDAFDLFDLVGEQHVAEPSVTSAVSTIIVELVNEYVALSEAMGSLHSAAVEIGGRLVVFPAGTRAGKSTLSTAFTAAGYRVFSDDLLPIDFATGEAVATGCLPRIRLPMPAGAPGWFGRHIAAHTVSTDGYYVYTGATPAGRVAFGDRARLGAIVLLDRSETPVEARLSPARLDDALTRVLSQDTRANMAADTAFTAYLDLVSRLDVHRFTYCDLDDAIACLDSAFSQWPDEEGAATNAAPETEVAGGISVAPAGEGPVAPAGAGPVFRRSAEVWLRMVDETGFLVDPATNRIHHVNRIGVGLWNLLARSTDLDAAVTVFAEAFPDVARERLAADIAALLAEFEDLGLVEREGVPVFSTPPVAAQGDRPAVPG